MCVELLPEFLALDPWGYPIVPKEQLPDELVALARKAAAACPTLALLIEHAGEERAGEDLRKLVEDARAIRNILSGLHSRYNRKVIEQAAIAGSLAAGLPDDPTRAIDMARIVLEHGQDPQVRVLAEELIAAQEAEIEMMEAWLAEHDS